MASGGRDPRSVVKGRMASMGMEKWRLSLLRDPRKLLNFTRLLIRRIWSLSRASGIIASRCFCRRMRLSFLLSTRRGLGRHIGILSLCLLGRFRGESEIEEWDCRACRGRVGRG